MDSVPDLQYREFVLLRGQVLYNFSNVVSRFCIVGNGIASRINLAAEVRHGKFTHI